MEVKFKSRGSAVTSKSKNLELNALLGSYQQQSLWWLLRNYLYHACLNRDHRLSCRAPPALFCISPYTFWYKHFSGTPNNLMQSLLLLLPSLGGICGAGRPQEPFFLTSVFLFWLYRSPRKGEAPLPDPLTALSFGPWHDKGKVEHFFCLYFRPLILPKAKQERMLAKSLTSSQWITSVSKKSKTAN